MKTRNVGLRIITAIFICHSSSSKCTEWRLMSALPPWNRGLGPGIALAGNDVEDDIGRVKALRSPSRRRRRTTIKLSAEAGPPSLMLLSWPPHRGERTSDAQAGSDERVPARGVPPLSSPLASSTHSHRAAGSNPKAAGRACAEDLEHPST